MGQLVIQGGIALQGSVAVSGSKNATLPMMAAALAADGETVLTNVPMLRDVQIMAELLRELGMDVQSGAGRFTLRLKSESQSKAGYQLVRQMRAGICVLGPLLAKRGQASVALPGGCDIGYRPIDLHLKGLTALGAEIEVRNGYVHASAKKLRGATIFLGGPNGSTATGTCNVMTAAALAVGETVIHAAACEPEVVALAEMLNSMGAKITGQGTSRLEIEGVEKLSGTQTEMIPDRIEAATLLIAAAMTRGAITITQVNPEHLSAVVQLLEGMGCGVLTTSNSISIRVTQPLRPFDFNALPFPGLPTDVQAQLLALGCTIAGTTVIQDSVFPDRFRHAGELVRMGASIRCQAGGLALVTGVPRLTGAEVMASDLRASAALVLAGLAAEGETKVHKIHHLDRGYQELELKLAQLGANIRRVKDDESNLTLLQENDQERQKRSA